MQLSTIYAFSVLDMSCFKNVDYLSGLHGVLREFVGNQEGGDCHDEHLDELMYWIRKYEAGEKLDDSG